MPSQASKVVNTHDHEIYGWKNDESYDEGFLEDCFDEKCWQGHPVLISINKKLQYAGFKNKDEGIKNYTWIS